MVSRNADASQQGESCSLPAQVVPLDRPQSRASNTVFKCGPLFISSKGLGWTSWKKRWFILTRTSLVFFRSDPSALPQKGGELNLTLGGIDLNNSGSVVVRADKKLLTVLFPNGGGGRGFTLKAETSEDLYEWKAALENALAQAPSANLVTGQTGIFRNDASDTIEGSFEQCTGSKRRPIKSLVVGRPILLALEDIDGSPSFLEKALRFIEQYGIKVEGILRLAADVEEVERRVQEYEQGKTEFSPDEDAHVVGDCIKHVLRELPSSPVPASCCTALLEAYRSGRESRVDAMHDAIFETFPEPNRRLLQRLLKMMLIVASHKSLNRMSTSAVAACMAPLLLRPLLAGECELDDVLGTSGDGSAQLLAAAAAANHAHAIVTTLLEEYDSIFEDETGSHSSDMYSDSEGSYTEGSMEDEEILEAADNGYHDAENDVDQEDDPDLEGDPEEALSGNPSGSICSAGSEEDLYNYKVYEGVDSDLNIQNDQKLSSISRKLDEGHVVSQHPDAALHDKLPKNEDVSDASATALQDSFSDIPAVESPKLDTPSLSSSSCLTKTSSKSHGSAPSLRRRTIWGRTAAKKNLSMESIDLSSDDEIAIQRLEITKNDLQNKIAKEAKGNAILQASLERRKQALHERRLALEQDVARLQGQLQKERDLRVILEAGLNMPPGNHLLSYNIDSKTRSELEEIAVAEADVISLKQRVADLHLQLNQQHQRGFGSICESCSQHQNHEHDQDTETASGMLHNEGAGKSEDTLFRVESGSARSQCVLSLPSSKSSKKQADSVSMTTHARPVKEATATDEGPASTSSTLVELTSRLDFLKERQSQLLNELHHLDGEKEKILEDRK